MHGNICTSWNYQRAIRPHSLGELRLPSSRAKELMGLTPSPEERCVHELGAGGSPGDRTCMKPQGILENDTTKALERKV